METMYCYADEKILLPPCICLHMQFEFFVLLDMFPFSHLDLDDPMWCIVKMNLDL